ncbi:MAG: ExeM/NucH family extracellular endonuclease [Ectothiorhodospiraceae bacterium]|nr:ExeM/NucH family extracellular endonuclease [Ectothiorhodospiraceae bacterium]
MDAVSQSPVARLRPLIWPAVLLLSLIGFLLFGQPADGSCDRAEEIPLAELLNHVPGGGDSPPGSHVVTGGVVTGVYPGRQGLNGFFIQDGHSETRYDSGLFVYAPALTGGQWDSLGPGVRVQVRARFDTYRGWPQLQRLEALAFCGEPGLPEPVPLELPLEPETLPRFHGLLVGFPQELVVTGNYELGRFGSLHLSAGHRLMRTRSGGVDDGLHQIVLDDGSYRSNPEPIPYLDEHHTRRAGDRVTHLEGVLVHAFDAWRVHPVGDVEFQAGNPRPREPEPVAGVRLATLNLENYFLTLGERGADSPEALERQRGKLLAALRGLDADLLALVELENSPGVLDDLLQRLNARLPPRDRYVRLDGPDRQGRDAIRVALVYRPGALEARSAVLADHDGVHNRPPVAAVFRPTAGGEPFLAAVVHHKSKTRCPDRGDVDRGQGCWNERRTRQSRALLGFIEEQRVAHDVDAVALLGDFNSYADEDPVRVLEEAGYINLVRRHLPEDRHYSYVFRGEAGMLDYIFGNASLGRRISGITVWHINADEPVFLAFDQRGGRRGLARNEPWRSSDHDPVMVGLDGKP